MYLYDIYEFFMNTYSKKSPECLLVWLSDFDYYDRVLFVNHFVINRLRCMWRCYPHFNSNFKEFHVKNCTCQDIFNRYLKDVMFEKTTNVWFLKKCAGIVKEENGAKEKEISNFNFCTECTFTTDAKTVRFNTNAAYDLSYDDLFKIDTTDFAVKKIDPKDVNVSIRMIDQFKETFSRLNQFIHLIDVRELCVLLAPHLPTIRAFDILLPEYMRLSGRRNRSRDVKSDGENLLMSIYQFFGRHNIQQVDSSMKMTNILPIIKYHDQPLNDANNEYFYQPRLAGIRIFICKTRQNNIIILNKNHVKINLNCTALQDLKLDLNHTYSGEFIIVLENIETETFVPKKYLLKYISNTMGNKGMYRVKLILLDLHNWQDVNLLTRPYSERYELFSTFIDTVGHRSTFVKIKNFPNTSMLYNHFNNYLNTTSLDSSLNGIIYRKKSCVYETMLHGINFNNQFQKHIILCKYSASHLVLHAKQPFKTIALKEPFCVLSPGGSFLTLHCICYDIDDKVVKLALYRKNFYVPLCTINTQTSNNLYKVLMKQGSPIMIKGQLYPWIIVKIGLSNDQDKVLTNLEFCPEKTLFDISRWFNL